MLTLIVAEIITAVICFKKDEVELGWSNILSAVVIVVMFIVGLIPFL